MSNAIIVKIDGSERAVTVTAADKCAAESRIINEKLGSVQTAAVNFGFFMAYRAARRESPQPIGSFDEWLETVSDVRMEDSDANPTSA